jgi:hypothetical protein
MLGTEGGEKSKAYERDCEHLNARTRIRRRRGVRPGFRPEETIAAKIQTA